MPIDFGGLQAGNEYNRDDLLRQWGLPAGQEGALFATDHTIALFITQDNKNRWNDRVYQNAWKGSELWIEVNEYRRDHNERLRRSPHIDELGLFYRMKNGQPFRYRGLAEFVRAEDFDNTELFIFRLL